ncbi:MAG TPA: hypothetical protein VEW48_19960 [Thermoanaerobaculia bacterium]|nr:hypothetical protein [Thermoanaerobaculia bacterium]
MATDQPDDETTGMGERLLRRAATPGVIRPDMAALQRRSAPGGAGLAFEIMRRWSPAASPAWGNGPGMPHVAGAQALTPGPSPASGRGERVSGFSELPGRVGNLHPSPARGRGAGGEGLLVQRQVAAAVPAVPPRPAAPPQPSPATTGPAIIRRSPAAGSAPPALPLRRTAEPGVAASPGAPAATASPAPGPAATAAPGSAEPTVQRAATTVLMGPAIVHRAAGRAPVQRASLPTAGAAPVSTAAPLSLAAPARTEPQAPVAGAPAAERGTVATAPSATAPPVIRRSATAQSAASVSGSVAGAAALPLVQPARPSTSPAAGIVQTRRDPGTAAALPAAAPPAAAPSAPVTAPAAGLSAAASGLAMPLARTASPAPAGGGDVVRRQSTGSSLSSTAPEVSLGGEAAAQPATTAPAAGGATAAAAAPAVDVEDVVDRVMRRLTRTLAVESERHGGRQWP